MSTSVQTQKRILLIANKAWEATPLMNVLLEPRACPSGFPWPNNLCPLEAWQTSSVAKSSSDVTNPRPRTIFSLKVPINGTNPQEVCTANVEVWCIQDWMSPSAHPSSSFEKTIVLPKIFNWSEDKKCKPRSPDFVVAFGTAGFPIVSSSYNGCVVIGANAFIYNAHKEDPNPQSPWDDSVVPRPIKPTLPRDFFGELDPGLLAQIESRLIVPPMCPAEKEILIAAYNYTAVSAVNITNYDEYAWADPKALEVFKSQDALNPAGSIETTHGIIRVQSDAPFMFVSGITDREGAFSSFNMEVSTRVYAQNFACAHNAGVAAAWLLPRIANFLVNFKPKS